MIECMGTGKAGKFAKIISSVALAGELSTLTAQANWRARTMRWDAEG
jgi:hydroxymethylglutaryl-CoA reductase